jgi:hypothetical protein
MKRRLDFEGVGGRSFALAVYVFHVVAIMRWFGKLDDPTFGMVVSGTVIAIIVKSSVDQHTNKRAEVQTTVAKLQAEAPPPTTVDQVPQ